VSWAGGREEAAQPKTPATSDCCCAKLPSYAGLWDQGEKVLLEDRWTLRKFLEERVGWGQGEGKEAIHLNNEHRVSQGRRQEPLTGVH
jgi:hypothetical protein